MCYNISSRDMNKGMEAENGNNHRAYQHGEKCGKSRRDPEDRTGKRCTYHSGECKNDIHDAAKQQ